MRAALEAGQQRVALTGGQLADVGDDLREQLPGQDGVGGPADRERRLGHRVQRRPGGAAQLVHAAVAHHPVQVAGVERGVGAQQRPLGADQHVLDDVVGVDGPAAQQPAGHATQLVAVARRQRLDEPPGLLRGAVRGGCGGGQAARRAAD